MKKTIIWTLALFFSVSISALEVNPNRAVIVVDRKADGVVKFAAQELEDGIGNDFAVVLPIRLLVLLHLEQFHTVTLHKA